MTNDMHSLLHDLYGHQAWADAEHWRAIDGFAPAREDCVLRTRLHHLHQVQRTFMWAVSDRTAPFTFTTPDGLATIDDLRVFARGSHEEIDRVRTRMSRDRLSQVVTMPWFDPPLEIAIGEVLLQAAMHSQWHRGQNSVRLRELGTVPPTVDLITWYAQGRPAPRWQE
jgi:uncharacterized damage-inducible protein DinB